MGLGLKLYTSAFKFGWWRWVESNYRSIGYEPIALTAEPHRHVKQVKNNKKIYICQDIFQKIFKIFNSSLS